ncbi:MAG: LON peptidase substrate-binding domain-containing protein, partial [Chthoniobacterales bacterium]|nr:LON peptidase substrate-binding domain-containing protein [Chthoniobacterales bacterium]
MNDQPFSALQSGGPQPGGAAPESGSNSTSGRNAPRIPETLSILPIRGFVAFPGTVVPLTVSRPSSIKLLDETLPLTKVIGLLKQRDEDEEEPTPDHLHTVGTAVSVLKLMRQPDDRVVILVQGLRRFSVRKIVQTSEYLRAEVDFPESISPPPGNEWQAEVNNLRESAATLIERTPDLPDEAGNVVRELKEAGQLTDFLAPNLDISLAQKQALLEEFDVRKRVRAVQTSVSSQLEISNIQQRLNQEVQSQFTDAQRKAYLRGQIKAIQRELGENDTGADEQIAALRTRLEEAKPPADVFAQAERELKRLDIIPAASPEYSVIVGYVETIASLPWSTLSEDNLDLDKAQEILDRDHYDLEKIKRRLIEYLAVRKLNPTGQGPILCLLGPPGVGKTSLGQSIADALGRKFSRMSLGGIRDEAEIRGHRRTYIGAMPGRIIQELRRVGTRNPVLMLDEIDKIGADFRGDPASALLEVLDP